MMKEKKKTLGTVVEAGEQFQMINSIPFPPISSALYLNTLIREGK